MEDIERDCEVKLSVDRGYVRLDFDGSSVAMRPREIRKLCETLLRLAGVAEKIVVERVQ